MFVTENDPRRPWRLCRAAAALALAAVLTGAAGESAIALTAHFADPAWDGKQVPEGQWCTRFGGHGATPVLALTGVPPAADAIILAFNDETFGPMNHGGHGVVGFRITGERPVILPSVPGETNTLPKGVWKVRSHRVPASGYSPGTAYLPPCSGGLGNQYSVSISAVKLDEDASYRELDHTRISLGRY